MMDNIAKSFNILVNSLNVLHNYFDSPTKLFSKLFLSSYVFKRFSKIARGNVMKTVLKSSSKDISIEMEEGIIKTQTYKLR